MDFQIPGVPQVDAESKHWEDQEYYSLHVIDLSYSAGLSTLGKLIEFTKAKIIDYKLKWIIPSLRLKKSDIHTDAPLQRVHFSAMGGEVTAVLGDSKERSELMNLLGGRKRYGRFDGDIRLSGPGLTNSTYYYDNMAYVQKKSLYVPGLTYLEMLRYCAQLRIKPRPGVSSSQAIEDNINQLLAMMNLTKCKDKELTTFPEKRGEDGAALRRLSIACEIIDLPPLIVIDEPTLDLDPAVSLQIMQCLRTLSKRGHVVICSISKPFSQGLDFVDRIVLLSEGYSIYAGSSRNARNYFCSPLMGYEIKKGVDLADFLLDISTGVERPVQERKADLPMVLQQKFEESEFYIPIRCNEESTTAFSKEFFFLWGYGKFADYRLAWSRIVTVVKRSFETKFRDADSIRFALIGPAFVGLFLGYLNLKTGVYGDYCTNLIRIPYAKTTNITSFFFFTSTFSWVLPFVSLPVICRRIELFRYEQACGCCTVFAFVLATVLSEGIFTVLGSGIFATVVFVFTQIGTTMDEYRFFVRSLVLLSLLGTAGAYLFTALVGDELLVRDISATIIVFASLLSGFVFQFRYLEDYFNDISGVNPIRWNYEGLMKWKFRNYKDGDTFLTGYTFQNFEIEKLPYIMMRFIFISAAIAIVALIQEPQLLRRRKESDREHRSNSASRDSVGSFLEYNYPEPKDSFAQPTKKKSIRGSDVNIMPAIFVREPSVTGRSSKLSVNVSSTGEFNSNHGPTVTFKDLSYGIRDVHLRPHSPQPKGGDGYKPLLFNVSGKFDWGKLSLIMGAAGSGKTSLLNVLAGDVPIGCKVSGKIMYDGRAPNMKAPLWQRCGYVPAQNEQLSDLKVREVLRFAMLLRCYNKLGLGVVEENVQTTIENLHLQDVVDKKTRKLNPGELKRLSIAEEMVHGPKLLFMDEPTTGLSIFEQSVLLLTFREMVNQDRTVIASIHQCAPEVFKLFDTLLLLSQGRVIYHGPISHATSFFTASPFAYNTSIYSNPADFLADVSGGFISDCKGDFLDAQTLEEYYLSSDPYKTLMTRLKPLLMRRESNTGVNNINNPLIYARSSNSMLMKTTSKLEGSNSLSAMVSGQQEEASGKVNNNDDALTFQTSTLPPIVLSLQLIYEDLAELRSWEAWETFFFKGWIMARRTFVSLKNRPQLFISSASLHAILAVLFGWIMGDSSGQDGLNNMLGYFGVFSVFQILLNIPLISFTFNNHGVFLKEHSRGLYTNLSRWVFTDYPIIFLRLIDAVLFMLISWPMINQDTDYHIYGFALFANMFFVVAAHLMSESLIFLAPDKRTCYVGITVSAFLNMSISGLMIKAKTLPVWLKPWATSVSIVRWSMQTHFINLYEDQDYFTELGQGYTAYISILNLYGWGGKTKWYCLGMLIIGAIAFKFLGLLTSGISAIMMKGGLQPRKLD